MLTHLGPDRWHLQADGIDQLSTGRLPWELAPLRLQGFLGHQWARSPAAAGFEPNPERWRVERLLALLLRERPDLPGVVRPGVTPPAPPPGLPAERAARLALVDTLADQAANALPAGSSAGGEQAKVLAGDDQGDHWLVKFSPPCETPFGERWHDLLLADGLALAVLAAHGVPVAAAELQQSARRSLLASGRGRPWGRAFCGASAARSAAPRWRRQVLNDDEYTPSRRISAPTSPGLVHRSAACRMRRLSALVNVRRRARGTTRESLPGATATAPIRAHLQSHCGLLAMHRIGRNLHFVHRDLGLLAVRHTCLFAH